MGLLNANGSGTNLIAGETAQGCGACLFSPLTRCPLGTRQILFDHVVACSFEIPEGVSSQLRPHEQ